MKAFLSALVWCFALVAGWADEPAPPVPAPGGLAGKKILVISGADPGKFHPWQNNLALIRERLAAFGITNLDMLLAANAEEWRKWTGRYNDYAVVLMIYWWEQAPEEELAKLDAYVRGGGGLVVAHSALAGCHNQKIFDAWTGFAYREHKPDYGSSLAFDSAGQRVVRAPGDGKGSYHEPIRPFLIHTHDREHPITAGLPDAWLQAPDELYLFLRGPDVNRRVLATADAPDGTRAPQAWVTDHDKGRIFCLTPGHHAPAASSVGFITLLARGLEWAATGKVTSKLPSNFPTPTTPVTELPAFNR